MNGKDVLTRVPLQIKRPQAKAYFAKAISDMYSEISWSDPTLQNTISWMRNWRKEEFVLSLQNAVVFCKQKAARGSL